VRVITRRDDTNNNPLATNFLRILGLWGLPLDSWNISVEAVAVKYVSRCLTDGFTAANEVKMNGRNNFYNDICIHGQNEIEDNGQDKGVSIRNDNTFDGPNYDPDTDLWSPGVIVSTPYPDEDITSQRSTCDRNDGLCSPNGGAKTAADSWPEDVYKLDAITQGLLDSTSIYVPDYMFTTDGEDALRYPMVHISTDVENLPEEYVSGTIYDISCGSGDNTINLPTGMTISDVVIVTNCRIFSSSAGSLQLENVVLASSYLGPEGPKGNAVHLSAQTILGAADYCEEGGGVEIYATEASVHISAGGDWHGLRIVAEYDVNLASVNNEVGVYGISVEAGHNIDMNSNNEFGLCTGGVPGVFVSRYRLVW